MQTILIIALCLILFVTLIRQISSRKLVLGCFCDGNVIVTGLRGRGKDLLFDWVINMRNKEYCSNVDYTKGNSYVPFEGKYLSLGGNTFENFIEGKIIPYEYPLDDGTDYYISDASVYFPSQENNKLNRWYPSYSLFQALSRHLGDCNFHCNCQNLNRLWDKIREQSDCYILMRRSRWHLHGLYHTMSGYVYDNYESCLKRIKPMKRRWGRIGKIEFDKFQAAYGEIRKFKIISFRRPSYDSRRFKKILEGDRENAENRPEETPQIN